MLLTCGHAALVCCAEAVNILILLKGLLREIKIEKVREIEIVIEISSINHLAGGHGISNQVGVNLAIAVFWKLVIDCSKLSLLCSKNCYFCREIIFQIIIKESFHLLLTVEGHLNYDSMHRRVFVQIPEHFLCVTS